MRKRLTLILFSVCCILSQHTTCWAESAVSSTNVFPNQVTLAAGVDHVIGLMEDGHVIAAGDNDDGQCNVDEWSEIVSISAGLFTSIGLKSDGTVVATGNNSNGECNVSGWSDIISIAAGSQHTVGLKSDGTVIAVGSNEHGQCNVSNWKNIKAIAAGHWHTLGIQEDGTVIAAGYNEFGQCNVETWSDIIAIDGGTTCSVGLASNGRVVYAGVDNFSQGQEELSKTKQWSDISSIRISKDYDSVVYGIQKDGTALATSFFYLDRNRAYTAVVDSSIGLLNDGTVVISSVSYADKFRGINGQKLKLPETNTGLAESLSAEETSQQPAQTNEESYHFRKSNWGDTEQDVINAEGTPDTNGTVDSLNATYIAYADKSAVGLDVVIGYYFCDDGLFQTRYILKEEHSNDDLYIEDYEKFREALTKKYGKPDYDFISWNDQSMKEYYIENNKSMGDALCYGYCTYYTAYILEDTSIFMTMSADNYEISTYIDYQSNHITPGEADYSDEI